MFKHKIGMVLGLILVVAGVKGLIDLGQKKDLENKAQERTESAARAAAAENSKKAEAARRALNSPMPGKVFDFDSKNNK